MRRLLPLLLTAFAAFAADPWPADLFNAGTDIWRARVAIDGSNQSAGPLRGFPATVSAAEAGLVGAQAQHLRVADAAGTEMLFDLRDADGRRLDAGRIPAGAKLTVPLTAEAGGTQRLYVYFDNPAAYAVPDFLNGLDSAANGGFEAGQALPEGWTFDPIDETYRLSWVADGAHSGQRCLKTTIAPGAEPNWTAARQRDLAVMPGQQYRLTAWVRGKDVVGYAGWYVHVATPENSQAVSKIVQAGDGTFDWRQVTIEFEAPADAVSLSHGSVLRGTGEAWFDDVTLERLGAVPVTVTVGQVERQKLTELSAPEAPYREGGQPFDGRADIIVNNPGPARTGALVQVRATPLWTRLRRGYNRDSVRVVDPGSQKVLPLLASGDDLLFVADLPASSRLTFAAWFSHDPAIKPGPALSYADLVRHPGNLASNPSFEQADGDGPAAWPGTTEGRSQLTARLSRERGGVDGDWCVRIDVPPTAPEAWVGWRQKVPVPPNGRYFVAAMMKTGRLEGNAAKVHVHTRNDAGELVGPRYWSSPTGLTADTDWTQVSGVVSADAATSIVEVHLTTNARGVIQHDGVVVMPAQVATLGAIKSGEPDGLGVQVWTENPIVKVFRDTPALPGAAAIDLAAGRGEQECAQLCLRSGRARPVTIASEPLRNGAATIAAPKVERVGYIPCLQPSGYFSSEAQPWERQVVRSPGRTDGWRGWWPDYLVPVKGELDLENGQTQPVWLTWDIPAGTPPGDYTGAVTITGPDQPALRVPVTLRVWKFTAPAKPTLQVLYDLRNGRGWQLFRSEEDWSRWWRFMADRKVSTDHVVPSPDFKLTDGKVTMDATAYDPVATLLYDELHLSAGYFPPIFYACGWAHPPRDFLGCKYPSPEYDSAYQQAVRLFWDHVKAKGWADRLSLYVSDEPHYYSHDTVVEWLAHVIKLTREVDPAIPVYSSTWGHEPRWDGILNHWGIAQYGRFPMDEWHQRRAAGDKAWFTTDGQMEIDTPYNATERLLPYYCFAEGVDGYEFWGFSWYTYDPYRFGWHKFIYQSSEPGEYRWVRYPNGDGFMAYPGEPLGQTDPISTIRLEQAREGIEDYEILVALQKLASDQPQHKAAIEAVLQPLREMVFIPNAGGYRSTDILPDPDLLPKLRREAGELLHRLGGE